MRNLNRGIAAGLLSAPLVLGMTGVAGAAEFNQFEATANSDGASTSQTQSSTSGTGSNGEASFQQSESVANEDGASVSGTSSQAGGNDGLLGILDL